MPTKKEAEKTLARTTDDDKQVEVRTASSPSDQRYSVNRVLVIILVIILKEASKKLEKRFRVIRRQ